MWEIDSEAIGHCNINWIKHGKEAYMHLHIWGNGSRKRGYGSELVRKSLPFYFENFDLDVLYCQPYAYNIAPNKTLLKVGFEFVKKYSTTPGPINIEQEVNLYKMTRAKYEELVGK